MIQSRKKPINFNPLCVFGLFFVLVFGYFYWFSESLLYFQEKQTLFIYSWEYLKEYFIKPGGPLELAGDFLTQFYIHALGGSVILAAILTLPGIVLYKINRRFSIGKAFSILFALIPSSLLLLMQTHYYHQMEYNLGFLLILLYFLLTVLQKKKTARYLGPGLFPLIYYLAGGYIWIFLALYLLYSIVSKQRFFYPVFSIIIAALSLFIFKAAIFLQPLEQLFMHPLPSVGDPKHNTIFYLLSAYIVLYPLLKASPGLLNIKQNFQRPVSLISALVVMMVTILLISGFYNPQTQRVLQLQHYVFEENYDAAIKLHETKPSRNLIGQYFYNVALSETGQLCDRMFFGRQDFGSEALILPWGGNHLNRGAYFFYSLGLINEAHRWAYEAMVVNGYRPQNIKLLAKTNLINGNYQMAEKYIDMLDKTLNYKRWAKKYRKLLKHPGRIQRHRELREKMKFRPEKDFFIQLKNPQNNIPLVIQSNPDNKKAFEYKIAYFLLNKNVNSIVNHIPRMVELNYTQMPRHVEEAVLAYSNSTGKFPDLKDFSISRKTRVRFRDYVSTYKKMRQNPSVGRKQMRNQFSNTFWFYFHFKKANSGSNN
jgi:hypothetical protein